MAALLLTAALAGACRAAPGNAAGQGLTVKALDTMRFDPPTLTLPVGQPVQVTLTNDGTLIHDFVLTEGVDFLRGASNTTLAAALAAAINAHAVLGKLLTALGSVGNCGLTGKVPSSLLHDINITTNDGTAFSFTQLNGGTEGAAQFFFQHFTLNRAP